MEYLIPPGYIPIGMRVQNEQYRTYMDRDWTPEMLTEPVSSQLEEILGILDRVGEHFGEFMSKRQLPASSTGCFRDERKYDMVVYLRPSLTGQYLEEARVRFPDCSFIRTIDKAHDMAGLHVISM